MFDLKAFYGYGDSECLIFDAPLEVHNVETDVHIISKEDIVFIDIG